MQDKIQNLKISLDSLNADLPADIPQRIDMMNELAWILRDSEAKYALTLSESAHTLAQQVNYKKGYAYSLRNLTVLHSMVFNNHDIALAQADELLAMPESKKDLHLKIRALGSIALVYNRLGEYGESLNYYNQVIYWCEQVDDFDYLSAAMNDVGIIYLQEGDYERALQTYKKALHLAKTHTMSRIQAIANLNIGEVLIMQHEYDKAKQHLEESLQISKQHNFYFTQALALNYIARIYSAKKEFDQAIKILLKAKETLSTYGNADNLSDILIDLGIIYQKQGRLDKSLSSLQQALKVAISANAKQTKSKCYLQLSNFYEEQGEWEQALQYHKQYQILVEEISNAQSDKKVKTLQVIYETQAARREAEIYRQKSIELEKRVKEHVKELQKTYEELSELDRLKSKFINDISHELRTPLANISLYLDLLDKGKSANKERYISTLREQVERLAGLVETALSLSLLDSEQDLMSMVNINLNEIIKQIAAKKQQMVGQQLTVSLNLCQTPIFVHGYLEKIVTMIEHIVNNAIKYTTSGEIIIRTRIDDDKNNGHLYIQDSGIGIAPEDMPHIFESFYRGQGVGRSNIFGTGLGLTIAKGTAMLHEGYINVESTCSVGTEVEVCLPLA